MIANTVRAFDGRLFSERHVGTLCLGVLTAFMSSSSCTTPFDNQDYCSVTNGDAFCVARHPSDGRTYCIWGSQECRDELAQDYAGEGESFDGCIATPPPPEGDTCYSPCGGGLDFQGEFACPLGELPSATSTTNPSSSGVGESAETGSPSMSSTGLVDSSTGAALACGGDADCVGHSDGPYCDPSRGLCASCGELGGSAFCAENDASLPSCREDGACVQCISGEDDLCTPFGHVCDMDTNQCRPCSAHEECEIGACHIFEGTCFPSDTTWISTDASTPDIGAIVNRMAPGGYYIIMIDGASSVPYSTTPIVVDDGKIIAIRDDAYGSPRPVIRSSDDAEYVIRAVGEATLYIQGVEVSGHTTNTTPVSCVGPAARLHVRGAIIAGNDLGTVLDGCEARLENDFLQSLGEDNPALEVRNASVAEVVYTTIVTQAGGGGGDPDDNAVLWCLDGSSLAMRNSLLLSHGGGTTHAEIYSPCANVILEHSVVESPPLFGIGVGNDVLEPPLDSSSVPYSTWFCGFATGDLHLDAGAVDASFADVMTDISRLEIAEPLERDDTRDIDGDLRSGSAMVGADMPAGNCPMPSVQ